MSWQGEKAGHGGNQGNSGGLLLSCCPEDVGQRGRQGLFLLLVPQTVLTHRHCGVTQVCFPLLWLPPLAHPSPVKLVAIGLTLEGEQQELDNIGLDHHLDGSRSTLQVVSTACQRVLIRYVGLIPILIISRLLHGTCGRDNISSILITRFNSAPHWSRGTADSLFLLAVRRRAQSTDP